MFVMIQIIISERLNHFFITTVFLFIKLSLRQHRVDAMKYSAPKVRSTPELVVQLICTSFVARSVNLKNGCLFIKF